MRILLTGGTGNVGRTAVARLVRNGHEVRIIGRRSDMAIEGADYRSCDITDFDSLREQVRDMEVVVHLAAIPAPGRYPGQEMFRINCMGSFNVYRAAADEGIKRVVSASSINALGYNYGIKDFDISYFPIDEEHPNYTTDPYSFSKEVLEDTAAYFWRREGISGTCLRLPGVFEMTDERRERMGASLPRYRERYEELMSLPEKERQARIEEVLSMIKEWRKLRTTGEHRRHHSDQSRHEYVRRFMLGSITNFWTGIDAEDSAQAIEKSLLADYEGSHPLFVNDSHNLTSIKSEALVSLYFPNVKERKHPLEGTECLVSIQRARELIDFEPEYSISRWFDRFL